MMREAVIFVVLVALYGVASSFDIVTGLFFITWLFLLLLGNCLVWKAVSRFGSAKDRLFLSLYWIVSAVGWLAAMSHLLALFSCELAPGSTIAATFCAPMEKISLVVMIAIALAVVAGAGGLRLWLMTPARSHSEVAEFAAVGLFRVFETRERSQTAVAFFAFVTVALQLLHHSVTRSALFFSLSWICSLLTLVMIVINTRLGLGHSPATKRSTSKQ